MLRVLVLPLLLMCSATVAANENVDVVLETNLGDIEIELFAGQAPHSAGSFLKFLDEGRYEGAGFNRVVRPDNDNGSPQITVIQGGLLDMLELQEGDLVPHETTETTGITHKDGIVSLARSGPSGSGAMFFICIGDQPSLDFGGARNADGQGFAAFGRVVSGMDVVRAINDLRETRSDPNPYLKNQMLKQPVLITRAYRK